MSFQATDVVYRTELLTDPTEAAVLGALAHQMDPRGRGAFLSQQTIARAVCCSPRTVRRTLAALERRGIIARGDQTKAHYLPCNRRPVVWDFGHAIRQEFPDALGGQGAPMAAPSPAPAPAQAPVGRGRAPVAAQTRRGDTSDLFGGSPVADNRTTNQYLTNGRYIPLLSPAREDANAPQNSSDPSTPPRPALPSSLAESDLSWTSPSNPRCQTHAHHQPGNGPQCRACREVRLEFKRRDDAAEERRRAERNQRRAAIAACPVCDEHGYVPAGDRTVRRCNHQNTAQDRRTASSAPKPRRTSTGSPLAAARARLGLTSTTPAPRATPGAAVSVDATTRTTDTKDRPCATPPQPARPTPRTPKPEATVPTRPTPLPKQRPIRARVGRARVGMTTANGPHEQQKGHHPPKQMVALQPLSRWEPSGVHFQRPTDDGSTTHPTAARRPTRNPT